MVMKQRSSAGKILLTIIIVIAVLLLLAEFGLRWFIGNQVVQALATQDTQTSSEQKRSLKSHLAHHLYCWAWSRGKFLMLNWIRHQR